MNDKASNRTCCSPPAPTDTGNKPWSSRLPRGDEVKKGPMRMDPAQTLGRGGGGASSMGVACEKDWAQNANPQTTVHRLGIPVSYLD